MSQDSMDVDVVGAPISRVSIQAEIAKCINFATHQCDVAVLAELVIANPLQRDLEDLTLRLSAEPKVLGDRVWTIDRIAAESEFRPRDRRVTIAGGMLDSLTERARAEVKLELSRRGTVLAESRYPVIALARNEWGGAQYMPELLAAFVTPNDPAVQGLLKEASRILGAAGKENSLEGYQARSRKRSWEIVSGIWAAVCRRGVTYAEPPASFGRQGQKIRLPSMIEEQGLATCLDIALLFAAAIEQAGLFPLVVFTEGHALVGVWLQPQTLPSLTVDDSMEIRKAIAQEELVLFEATMATSRQALPFSRAVAEGKRQVSEAHEDSFVYALDIRQARGRGILPLSSLAGPAAGLHAGYADTSRAEPPLEDAPDLPPFDADTVVEEAPRTAAERLDRWKRSLLDLSKRNRLLNLTPSATAIPIFCPDPALLEDEIAEGKKIRLITAPERTGAQGEPDPELYHLRTGEEFAVKFATDALGRNEIVANVDPKILQKGATELYRKAKADFEEGGANTLFLALGMLRWSAREDTKRTFRAPLILLPVKLERRSAASRPFLTAHEDDPVFNLTLLQMLRQDFQIEIPALEGVLPSDDHGVNVRLVWEMVRSRIRDVPGFEVVEEVVLSTFSFTKYLMWKDLADRTETLKESPFVRHVIDTPREPYGRGADFLDPAAIDREIDPSDIMAPLNADSSQIVAIHASGKDGDFVLEGPPGTGKSETIGNIIAHNLGLGHRVLFVSEKMAALDVVYRRLSSCGLGDFCLELHSAKASKRAVIGQLGAAWEKRRNFAIEEWRENAARLKDVRDQLNRLVGALHAPGPGGLSPRDAIGRSLRYGDVHRLRLDWPRDDKGCGRAPTREALGNLEDLAKRLGQAFGRLQPEDLTTFKGIAHTEWSYAWVSEVVAQARALHVAVAELNRRRCAFTERLGYEDSGKEPDESAAVAEVAALVPECAELNLRFALEPNGQEALDALETLLWKLEDYRKARGALSYEHSDDLVESVPLQVWLSERKAAEAKIWPIKVLARRRLRRAMWSELNCNAVLAPEPERDLETLIQLAEKRRAIDALGRSVPRNTPWHGLDTDSGACERALRAGRRLREAVLRLSNFEGDLLHTRDLFVHALCDERERLQPGMPIAACAVDLVAAYRSFFECLTGFRVASGLEDHEAAGNSDLDALSSLTDAVVARERRLNVWCAWVSVCREAREEGLGALVPALEDGAVAHDQTVEVFRTAYACWLAPILIDARPELTRFSSVQHADLIQTFRDLDKEFSELTAAYIRAKLSAEVPTREVGGAGSGYGVLSRELQKRIRHKPVRQLISEMGSALTTLTPCLMMSPLSVAQFLPAEIQAFDLVVFDEASQITVPDAIGAIARGQRCIVVGDPRQMPPTRFFERGPEDDENEEVRDLESILDEALAARMPHHRLTGHYRSRHESLICFSNHAYYRGTLITYPSANTRDTAVTLRRVDGLYAKGSSRTNALEAKAVVGEVVRRLRDIQSDGYSIGVVTFNSEQQRLIEDLLDQERRADPDLERFFNPSVENPVFVKNLETVQGDERDVILLSVGYGPTEPGARTMSMNFGPLNRQGGERRLNVAITRATTEVVVFASFDASMIDLTRTPAAAVEDLKRYLDFAARGPVALGDAVRAISTNCYDSDFEMAVAERLRSLGWTVRTQIGVSKFRIDLGVVDPDAPGRFLAGIECDGATYHSSPSARDRDRVRQIILERLGWRLIRVWSTDFFLDPEASVSALDASLQALLEKARAAAEDPRETAAEEVTTKQTHVSNGPSVDGLDDRQTEDGPGCSEERASIRIQDEQVSEALPGSERARSPGSSAETTSGSTMKALVVPGDSGGGEHERPKTDAPAPDPERFYEPSYFNQLKAIVASIIDDEGPITFKRLSDLTARAHGFQRTGRQISSTVWKAGTGTRRYIATPDGHKVFWPAGVTPALLVQFRGLTVNGKRREWREVPHPEKLWLVRKVLGGGGAPVRAIADMVGIGRVTTQFRREIEELRHHLESN